MFNPFTTFTYFFQTLIEHSNNTRDPIKNIFLNLFVHLLYFIVIASLLSILILFVDIYFINELFDLKTVKFTCSIFWWVFLFIMLVLISIYSLNFSNGSINLPAILLNFYFIFKEINFTSLLIKTLFWFTGVAIAAYFLLNKIITALLPNSHNFSEIALLIFLFFIVFLYSEGTVNTVIKIRRQFILWILLFICLIVSSIFQVMITAQGTNTNEETVFLLLALFVSLIFNFSKIVDNTRSLYSIYVNEQNEFDKRKSQWTLEHSKFSYLFFQDLVKRKYKDSVSGFSMYKRLPSQQRKIFNRQLLLVVIGFFTFLFIALYFKKNYYHQFERFIDNIMESLFSILANFTGSFESAVLIVILLPILYFFFNKLPISKSELKNYNIKQKLILFDQCLFLFASIILITCILFKIVHIPIVLVIIYLLFLISLVIFPLVIWIIKKVKNIKY